jgi:hypothetical protein
MGNSSLDEYAASFFGVEELNLLILYPEDRSSTFLQTIDIYTPH